MQIFLKILGVGVLVAMVAVVVLFCMGQVAHETVKRALSAGTLLWFMAVLPLRFLQKRTEP